MKCDSGSSSSDARRVSRWQGALRRMADEASSPYHTAVRKPIQQPDARHENDHTGKPGPAGRRRSVLSGSPARRRDLLSRTPLQRGGDRAGKKIPALRHVHAEGIRRPRLRPADLRQSPGPHRTRRDRPADPFFRPHLDRPDADRRMGQRRAKAALPDGRRVRAKKSWPSASPSRRPAPIRSNCR